MTAKEALNKLDETVTGDLEWKIVLSKALEKQIPKKVTIPACPSCHTIFLFYFGEKRKGNHCDNCGQALDWSDWRVE